MSTTGSGSGAPALGPQTWRRIARLLSYLRKQEVGGVGRPSVDLVKVISSPILDNSSLFYKYTNLRERSRVSRREK
jgi:hypothetical protein